MSIARLLYSDASIVFMDDPLSAVDAHVGKALFFGAIQGALAGKTRVLVTNALHFLPHVDSVRSFEWLSSTCAPSPDPVSARLLRSSSSTAATSSSRDLTRT